jgi:hypothetical protein
MGSGFGGSFSEATLSPITGEASQFSSALTESLKGWARIMHANHLIYWSDLPPCLH